MKRIITALFASLLIALFASANLIGCVANHQSAETPHNATPPVLSPEDLREIDVQMRPAWEHWSQSPPSFETWFESESALDQAVAALQRAAGKAPPRHEA